MEDKIKSGISIWESIKTLVIILGFQILVGVVEYIFIGIFNFISGSKISLENSYLVDCATIIGYIITYKYLNEKNKYEIKFINTFDRKLAVCCLFIVVGYILIIDNSINLVIEHLVYESWVERAFAELEKTPLAAFCSLVFIAPIFEELFMRGIILEQLSRRYKPIIAIIISALLFGIMHWNITQGVGAFLFGIILGLIYLKTKNLTICIFLHGANNLFFYFVCYFPSIYEMNFSITKLFGGIIIFAVSSYFFKGFKNVT